MSTPLSPEHLVISVSKDVEALTKVTTDNALLFRENQAMLNRVLADMQEHKSLDARVHDDFKSMQNHIIGTTSDPGLLTKVHDLQGKVASLWKLLWAVITAAVTGAGAYTIVK